MSQVLAGLLAGFVVAAVPADVVQARAHGRCRTDGARVLHATSRAVIHRVPARPHNPGTFGCATAVGARRWLGDGRGRERFLGPLAVAGSRVAYELTVSENSRGDGATSEVRLLNLRTGRLEFRAPPTSTPERDVLGPAGGVRAVVLTATGGVAWMGVDESTTPASPEVWVADAAGRRLLARGSEIDPRSLAVSRNRIFWFDGTAARTDVLSGRARATPAQAAPLTSR